MSSHEERMLQSLQLALRVEEAPSDLYLASPEAPPSQWQATEPLSFQPNWKEIEEADAVRRFLRSRPSGTGLSEVVGPRRANAYEVLKEKALCAGKTRREYEEEARRLSKFRRAQVRAGVAYKKALRRWRQMDEFADANSFVLPGKIEELVEQQVCSNSRVPKRSSYWDYKPQRNCPRPVREENEEKKKRRRALLESIERKLNRWSIEWREARADRRARARHIWHFENHRLVRHDLKPCQVRALIEGWQLPALVKRPDWCLLTCPIGAKIPGFDRFMSDQLNEMYRFHPNMEEDAHGTEEIADLLQKSDVAMLDVREKSVADPFPQVRDAYADLSVCPKISDENASANRWFTIVSFDWMKSHTINSMIFSCELPRFLLENFPDSPNAMLMKQHVYWRGDMVVRVVANCNARQIGQLQCRFYYGAQEENYFNDLKTNIYVGSQQPHCLITANHSNVGEIRIPFEYIRPYLLVAEHKETGYINCSLGKFMCFVVVPLDVASTTQQSCRVSVQIAFENNRFAGQVYRGFQAQMGLPEVAHAALDLALLNLDKPTDVQKGDVILPQNTGAWSAGLDISEWSVPLRLSLQKTLPYESGRIPPLDEMNIKHLTSIFGMVAIVDWKNTWHSGHPLWSMEASPTWHSTAYPSVEVNDSTCYVLPPVSVISNMFAYWRGSLRLRIDVVGAIELTGRLLVCYVPRASDETIDIKYAVCCPHAIFDLQENRQFTFEIPYVADKMFWPKHDTIDWEKKSFSQPGMVYVMVYNDLIANSTIPSDCKLVMYLAGGDDFEVSVPCAPSIGLSITPDILITEKSKVYCNFKEGYYPVYVGNWHGFGGGEKVIFRYSPISDHVAQLTSPDWSKLEGKVCKPLRSFACRYGIKDLVTSSSVKWVDGKFFIPIKMDSYYYLVPFDTKEKAKAASAVYGVIGNFAAKVDYYGASSPWCLPKQMTFIPADLSRKEYLLDTKRMPRRPFYGQMDERAAFGSSLAPLGRPQTTGMGERIMGERFSDLKDLTRRYQRYAQGNFNSDPTKFPNFEAVQLRFPAMPQGLDLDIGTFSQINEYWNRTRDGPIPLVASGYKFFTGGLRFRVHIACFDNLGNVVPAKIFVQHRPGVGGSIPEVLPIQYSHRTTADLEMPGFAYHIQTTDINSIVSIEVPYYLPSIRGYLHRPSQDYFSSITHSLGLICISAKTQLSQKFNFEYDIFYSLADDTRFSIFQGFPPMIFNFNIPDVDPAMIEADAASEPEFVQETRQTVSRWKRFANLIGLPEDLQGEEDLEHIKEYYAPEEEDNLYLFLKKQFIINGEVSIPNFKHKVLNYYRLILLRDGFISSLALSKDEIILALAKDKRRLELFRSGVRKTPLIRQYNDTMVPQGDIPIISDACDFVNNVRKGVENISKLDTQKVNETVASTSAAAEAVAKLAENLNAGTEKIANLFTSDASTEIDEDLVALKKSLADHADHMISLIINIGSFTANPTITSFVTAVLNVLMHFKLVTSQKLFELGTYLTEWLKKKFQSPNEPYEGEFVPNGDLEDDTALASYISTLIAGVAGLLNFTHSLCFDKKRALAKILLGDLKDFAMTANHVFQFCKNNILAIKHIIEWLWKSQPGLEHINFFEEFDKEIFEWAKECEILLDGRNKETVSGNLVMANRVYECANQACLINLKLINLNKNHKVPQTQLAIIKKLSCDILKLRDQLARVHIAPPVKFEPYVVHIYGDIGIGKSFCSQDLPFKMLDHIKYKSYNEIVYVRTAGNAYWNGLSHQPVVLFDDWYQSSAPEFGGVQVAELLQLKTRAVFNPPMAAVEDKGIRYNPLIVFLLSNNAFPKYDGICKQEAIYRRVDYLVHCRRTPDYVGVPAEEIPEKVLNTYQHLEFARMNNLDKTANPDVREHHSYDEFLGEILTEFRNYYQRELIKYNKAIKRISMLYPQKGEDSFKLPHHQFWTKSETYLEFVDYEDHDFNVRYAQLMRDYASRKILSLQEAVLRAFNVMKPNAEADDLTDDGYLTPIDVSTHDGSEVVVNRLQSEIDKHFGCVHSLLRQHLEEAIGAVEWDSKFKMWRVVVDSSLVNWDIVRQVVSDDQRTDEPLLVTYFMKVMRDVAKVEKWEIDMIPELPTFLTISVDVPDCRPFKFQRSGCWFEANSNTFFIPHGPCYDRCFFLRHQASKFVSDYIAQDTFLSMKQQYGEPLVDDVPQEYLNIISGASSVEEDAEEKVSWLKGFWKKILGGVLTPNKQKLYLWVSRILHLLLFFAPIIQVFLAVRRLNAASNDITDAEIELRKEFQQFLAERRAQPQGFASGDHRVAGRRIDARSISTKVLKPNMGEEEFESLRIKLRRNTFFFLVEVEEEKYTFGRCLGLFGQVALFPTHYRDVMDNCRSISFVAANNPIVEPLNLAELKFRDFDNSSLSIVILPKRIPRFKDICYKFASEQEHQRFNGLGKILEVEKPKEHKVCCSTVCHNLEVYLDRHIQVAESRLFKGFEVADSYLYQGYAGSGKCGAMLIANNLPCGLIGMHVAGNDVGEGMSEAITREMIELIKDQVAEDNFDVFEPQLGDVEHVKFHIPSVVLPLGSVPRKLAHRESEKSRIVPSLIQKHGSRENFPIYTDVAVLSPNDPRLVQKFSPMIEGCYFHGLPLKPFDSVVLSEIEEDLTNMYLANCKPLRSNVGKLSKVDVIRGIDGLDGYDALEWRTSEGFPFVASRPWGSHDKRWLFEFSGGRCTGVKPELAEVLKFKKEQRKQGIIPFTVFTDCLKDTTVAKAKVLIPGKTRIFSMSPVDFTIAQRQLTLDFSAAMMKCRLDLEHAVGINPDSMEWTTLAGKLLEKGDKIVTGDYTKFGDSIPFEIILMFFRVVNAWYRYYSKTNKQTHDQQRLIQAEEIGHAVHLMFDLIYRCYCGQPSGCPLTVLINTFANSVYVRAAWLSIMARTIYAGLAMFKKHVCLYSYGDDIILAVSDEVAPYFNAKTMQEFFAKHDLKFTNANKSEEIIPFQGLEDSDFLKRGFAPHPDARRRGVLLAPLQPASIEDTVNWIWDSGYESTDERCPLFKQMCLQVCEDATRNAWTRGPDYYNQFCSKLQRFWRWYGEYVVYDSWRAIDNRVFDLNVKLNNYTELKGLFVNEVAKI